MQDKIDKQEGVSLRKSVVNNILELNLENHTRYGKLIKKIMACSEKRKALQLMKKNARKLIDETK